MQDEKESEGAPATEQPQRYQPRPSRCMAAAKAAERDRLMAMTARERAELALTLGRRYAALADSQGQTSP